eukprot:4860231-Prymnesium_polylepis.1
MWSSSPNESSIPSRMVSELTTGTWRHGRAHTVSHASRWAKGGRYAGARQRGLRAVRRRGGAAVNHLLAILVVVDEGVEAPVDNGEERGHAE